MTPLVPVHCGHRTSVHTVPTISFSALPIFGCFKFLLRRHLLPACPLQRMLHSTLSSLHTLNDFLPKHSPGTLVILQSCVHFQSLSLLLDGKEGNTGVPFPCCLWCCSQSKSPGRTGDSEKLLKAQASRMGRSLRDRPGENLERMS